MRLPRMNTRRWMVAVAVLALGCAGLVAWERTRACWAKASAHFTQAEFYEQSANGGGGGTVRVYGVLRWTFFGQEVRGCNVYKIPGARNSEERARLHARAQYHERMGDKYARAARYPWLPLPPDPPLPE